MLKVANKASTGLLIVFSALTLSACSGGSSSGGTAPAAVKFKPGIFRSIIANESEGTGQKAFTLLSSSGKYSITSGKARTSGTLTFPSSDTLSDDNGTYVFFDEKWVSLGGSLKGKSINSEEFAVTFTSDTAEPNVNFKIRNTRDNELSDIGVTLQELSETYSLDKGQDKDKDDFVVTISADGSKEALVTGSTLDGCAINGSVTVPNSAFNIFEGSLTFSGCPGIDDASSEQRDGKYEVIGYLQPLEKGLKRLVFSSDNGDVTSIFSGTN